MKHNKSEFEIDSKINEIVRVFDLLSLKEIPFIALRGYDFLWNSTAKSHNDIDLLIPKSALSKTKDLFIELGYFSVSSPGHIGYGKINDDKKIAFDFQIDFIRQRNIPYLDFKSALKDNSVVNGIPILSGEKLAFHLIVHSLLGRGYLLSDYKRKILEIYKAKTPDRLKPLLKNIFGEIISDRIIQKIKEKKFTDLENKKFRYLIYAILNNPRLLLKFSSYINFRLYKKIKPGKVISFIGLDGTGKTTAANMLVDKFKKCGLRAEYRYMGRKKNHFLPMHKVSKIAGVSEIQTKKQPTKLYLITRELIYFLDFSMRYYFTILPRILSGTSIVCDRYAYDFFLDKYFSSFSYLLLRFFYPRPHLLIFLDVDEDEIIRRKNENGRNTRHHYLNRLLVVKRLFNGKRIIAKGKKETLEYVCEHAFPLILK